MASSLSPTDDYVEGPRHAAVTADDVGPVITIVSLVFMVTMILAVMLRLFVRFSASHVPGLDDAVVSIALFVAIGEVIAISVTVNHGLGTRSTLLSTEQAIDVAKGVYAANILYLITIALAKASTLLLLNRLTVSTIHKAFVCVVALAISFWLLAAVLGTAFECQLPNPWLYTSGRCIDIESLWYAIGALDIMLDIVLVAMPVWIVWVLQMRWRGKGVVITGFAFRLCLCVAQALRLAYLHGFSDPNPYSSLGYILATEFQTTFAVIIACIPAYKSFMDRAASGLIGVSFKERGGTYQLSSIGRSAKNSERSKQSSRKRSAPVAGSEGDYHVEISAHRGVTSEEAEQRAQKTVEWEVRFSDEAKLTQHGSANGRESSRASASSMRVSPVE